MKRCIPIIAVVAGLLGPASASANLTVNQGQFYAKRYMRDYCKSLGSSCSRPKVSACEKYPRGRILCDAAFDGRGKDECTLLVTVRELPNGQIGVRGSQLLCR